MALTSRPTHVCSQTRSYQEAKPVHSQEQDEEPQSRPPSREESLLAVQGAGVNNDQVVIDMPTSLLLEPKSTVKQDILEDDYLAGAPPEYDQVHIALLNWTVPSLASKIMIAAGSVAVVVMTRKPY